MLLRVLLLAELLVPELLLLFSSVAAAGGVTTAAGSASKKESGDREREERHRSETGSAAAPWVLRLPQGTALSRCCQQAHPPPRPGLSHFAVEVLHYCTISMLL